MVTLELAVVAVVMLGQVQEGVRAVLEHQMKVMPEEVVLVLLVMHVLEEVVVLVQ
jgi:hypothetical protein